MRLPLTRGIETRGRGKSVGLDSTGGAPVRHGSAGGVIVASLLLCAAILLVLLWCRRHHARGRSIPCLKHRDGARLLGVRLDHSGHHCDSLGIVGQRVVVSFGTKASWQAVSTV